jgi:hypothetical protein
VRSVERILWGLAAASLAVAFACVLWFVVRTIGVRVPYWGEAEVLFESRRIAHHLPLFVDPTIGAHDMGEPPSRWFVTYPPILTALMALVPDGAAMVVGRVLATLAWLGALFGIAWSSRARMTAFACAAFVAGIWILANFATVGRPDAVACALAAAGLVRATKRGRIDPVAAILLACVPWVKPTIIGLPLGAFLGDLLSRRRAALPSLAIGAGVALAIGVVLQLVSGGQLLAHVIASNAQPFTLAEWRDHVPDRLPFFAPLFALAAWGGIRSREKIALGALALSALWVLVALAKTGSASNYWMEPCIAALVLIAHAPPPWRFGEGGVVHAGATLAVVLYADVASVRGSIGHASEYRTDAEVVARARNECSGAIAADEAGIELVTNGRILIPTYQTMWLVKEGRFPAATWISELDQVSCVVEHSSQLRLVPELARTLDERFVVDPNFVRTRDEDGFRLLRRR